MQRSACEDVGSMVCTHPSDSAAHRHLPAELRQLAWQEFEILL